MEAYNCYDLIGIPKKFIRVVNYLMKDLGKQNFVLTCRLSTFQMEC